MGEESSPVSDVSVSSRLTFDGSSSTLLNSVDNWCNYGHPYFVDMLSQVKSHRHLDPMADLLLFKIVGGFSHAFAKSWKISDYDSDDERRFSEAFAAGMLRLSETPQISQMVEGFIQGRVDDRIGGMV